MARLFGQLSGVRTFSGPAEFDQFLDGLDLLINLLPLTDATRGILCQKPLAMNFAEAQKIVELCARAGVKLAVNSNMRYDQSMRVLLARALASGHSGTCFLLACWWRTRS